MGVRKNKRDSLRLFLDLGDVMSKGVVEREGRSLQFVFPSVVARRLLDEDAHPADLLLDKRQEMLRMTDFDHRKYPRTRSYPREAAYRNSIREVPRARYAGRLAVTLGADRQLLGRNPTDENIDALVHRAFFRGAGGCRFAEVIFVLDIGVKAQAILRYVEKSPRSAAFLKWDIRNPKPVLMQIRTQAMVLDSADCAAAALPSGVALERVGRILLLDIGYLRTKLAIMSTGGCEHQEQLDGLGVSDCVRRVLRDGQEDQLVEDEYAVIRALERSQNRIQVAGRRFDVGKIHQRARRGLEEELAGAARRVLTSHYGKGSDVCKVVAIIGGGAAVVGKGLADRLEKLDLGLDSVWIAGDTRFFLLGGARRIHQRQLRAG